MSEMIEILHEIEHMFAARMAAALQSDGLRSTSDDELCAVLTSAAGIARRAEAVIIEATAQVTDRSRTPVVAERLTTTVGCRSVRELLQRCTKVSSRTARSYEQAATAVHREVSFTSGEVLPAPYPHLRTALAEGVIGLDGFDAALAPLRGIGPRLSTEARLVADADLAAHARGCEAQESDGAGTRDDDRASTGDADALGVSHDPSASLACSAEDLRSRSQLLSIVLDPDGAEPRELRSLNKRSLSLGPEHDGLVRVQGHLLPETAAQLRTLLDAFLNPKVDGVRFRPSNISGFSDGDGGSNGGIGIGAADAAEAAGTADAADAADTADDQQLADDPLRVTDDRTRPQRMHDAFAGILGIAARHRDMPRIGGSAPTLVVSINADDLHQRSGWAHVQGSDTPLSLQVAHHAACEGRIMRVVQHRSGRVVSLGVADRVFNAHQRRAILLRDGGCAIPGCHVPATWCELHHVDEHARGGATHVDNGVALCWFHHRTLGIAGWEIRMRDGVPEVRAPNRWDPSGRWRPVGRSRLTRERPPPEAWRA